jgi:membrane protease YdiL (CAAX protease family)
LILTAAPWSLAVIAVLMVGSLGLGFVRWEPKFPPESGLWLGVNLLFTCTAEELLFRGFIQRELQSTLRRFAGGRWIALVVASILFGFAHLAGGLTYVGLATLAGVGYGFIYQRTQRIEASILTHFALNSVHFFAFTYPALAHR